MLQVIPQILLFITAALASELSIVHHPSSIIFKGHEHVDSNSLTELYSASVGFSVERSNGWPGMYLRDPFDLAQAIVTVVVDGVSNPGHTKGHHFPLRGNEDEYEAWQLLERRIVERYPVSPSKLVRVELSEGVDSLEPYKFLWSAKPEVSKNTKSSLRLDVEEDRRFLEELSLLNAVADKIKNGAVKPDYSPDVYWFVLPSLRALSDLHGENSTETQEAKRLFAETLSHVTAAFNKAYNGRVLVTVLSTDAGHNRVARSLLQAEVGTDETSPFDSINLSKVYNQDYPVIFNIILWLGVALAFSLLAISISIGDMDPGRDSIIYRMTSNRMKKDN